MPRFPKILVFLSIWAMQMAYGQTDELMITPLASGFSVPVDIAHAGDHRLFVVEKRGVIRIMDTTGQVFNTPFLDIDARVNSGSSERGLLGLAFHPDYLENGYFFVNYTDFSGMTVIARYSRDTSDMNIASPGSEVILLKIAQPFSNHNAGDLAFGPDGYLYIGTGDGGSGGDPGDRAQNPQLLLGKMLRIDVDQGDPYGIPPDNPFAEDDFTLDEIWAIGLRNPWRYAFDRVTGDLLIADVGQNAFEEVNFQKAGSPGGQNYGWRCYEAESAFNLSDCPEMDSLTGPVFFYAHTSQGCSGSITGGFVYRGSRYPDLYGTYIMTDYCTGVFRGFELDDAGNAINGRVLLDGNAQEYTSFGEDASGELYLAGGGGTIYRVEQTPVSSTSELTPGLWTVSPNPCSNALFVRNADDSDLHVSLEVVVYNNQGYRILSESIPANGHLDVTGLAAGVYLLNVQSKTHNSVLKFSVIR